MTLELDHGRFLFICSECPTLWQAFEDISEPFVEILNRFGARVVGKYNSIKDSSDLASSSDPDSVGSGIG